MPATAEPATTTDIVAILEDKEMLLAELAELVDAKVIGKAWAAGLIEFGRRAYCTTGQPVGEDGTVAEGSILIIEGLTEWTGPKSGQHKTYANLAGEELPHCERYERADVPMIKRTDPKTDRETYHRPQVKREEAVALVGLRVRLTDKGLATMAV